MAVLGALVAPALIPSSEPAALATSVGAGLVTALVIYRTRNLLLAVTLGMLAYWILGAAL